MSDDAFDDGGLDDTFDDFSEESKVGGPAWKSNPLVKVGVVVGAVVAIFLVINLVGNDEEKLGVSSVGTSSDVSVAPGVEDASPAYIQAIEEQNEADKEHAEATGGSALPVPIEPPVGIVSVPGQEEGEEDPLQRWRRLQEERLQREIQQREVIETVSTQDISDRNAAVNELAELMQEQMSSILDTKSTVAISTLSVTDPDFLTKLNEEKNGQDDESVNGLVVEGEGEGEDAFTEEIIQETLVPAGEIVYAQLLTEANTDSPGPVLAEVMAGPLAGSRILGSFSEQSDLLTLNFDTVVIGEESVSIDAVALDPDTTLPGMATEVDHRYFQRILLPAAAAFVEGLSSAIAEGGTTNITVNSGGGSTSESDEDLDSDQEIATGVAEVGDELRDILDDIASDVEVLVRIDAGTPIGILFLEPVQTEDSKL